MTRAECETRIAKHMEAIIKIAKQYNPRTTYLSAYYCVCNGTETYGFNNEYFVDTSPDAMLPIEVFKSIEHRPDTEATPIRRRWACRNDPVPYVCPVCGEGNTYKSMFCPECGERLVW